MARELKVVGKPLPKQGDTLRATGRAVFTSDVKLPGMLHGSMVLAPYPKANIISIDTTAAEAVPGVKLVMTHENTDVLQSVVRFMGQQVACVIAISEEIAEQAKELIKIEYEQLPFVLDPHEAMASDAPRVFKNFPNVRPYEDHAFFSEPDENDLFIKREARAEYEGYGDIEDGFAKADIIVEDEGYAFNFAHCPVPERRGCVADWDGERISIYSVTQSPQSFRQSILWSGLGFGSINQIRFLNEFNSGSFGGRGDDSGFYRDGELDDPTVWMGAGKDQSGSLAILASMKLSKPVRVFFSSNDDHFNFYWGRGGVNFKIKMGFKKDGTLTAWEEEDYLNTGLYGNKVTHLFRNGSPMQMYSHNLPATRIKKNMIHTNIPGTVGWSGYGNPEHLFASEQIMDIAAEELGIDPIELRKINCMRPGDNILSANVWYKHTGGNYLGGGDYAQLLDKLAAQVGWENRKPHTEKVGVIRSGMGMAITTQQCAGEGVGSNAVVKLNMDGSAELCNAYADTGMGGRSACGQIAAEVLGISFDKVRVVAGDTDASVWGQCNQCSGGTVKYGWAVHKACEDALNKLFALAAPMLGVTPDALATENAEIYVKANPSARIPWAYAFFSQGGNESDPTQIVGTGVYLVPSGAKNQEKAGTFCTLDVDTETGELKNVKIYHCADVGCALNDKDTRAQILRIHHGWEASIGGTMRLDKATGKLLNGNYIDYPVATMLDCDVEPSYIESGEKDTSHPFGAVGLGQALQNAVHAAAANAIYNAIGVRIKEVPMTPDVILRALGKI